MVGVFSDLTACLLEDFSVCLLDALYDFIICLFGVLGVLDDNICLLGDVNANGDITA